MASEVKKEIELEIAHVLFADIVGYSKLPVTQQRAVIDQLNEIVRSTDEFQAAEKAGRLIKIPTGDGMALVFITIRRHRLNVHWKSRAARKTNRNFDCVWACTAARSAA
jgi:hypothetical protein